MPHGRRRIIRCSEHVRLDITGPGRRLFHAVSHILHMRTVQLQKFRPDKFIRIIFTADMDCLVSDTAPLFWFAMAITLHSPVVFNITFPPVYFLFFSTSAYTRKYLFVPLLANGSETDSTLIRLSRSRISLNYFKSFVVPWSLIFSIYFLLSVQQIELM